MVVKLIVLMIKLGIIITLQVEFFFGFSIVVFILFGLVFLLEEIPMMENNNLSNVKNRNDYTNQIDIDRNLDLQVKEEPQSSAV